MLKVYILLTQEIKIMTPALENLMKELDVL